MNSRRRATVLMAVTAAAATALAPTVAFGAATTGTSTTVAPYVLPVADGLDNTSLLTVGDKPADNGFRMVGVPDGLGAHRQGSDLVVFENQELSAASGVVRRHGQTGAFVSRFVIDRKTGRVIAGSDLINPGVKYWDYPAGTYSAAPVAPVGAAPGTHAPAYHPLLLRIAHGSRAATARVARL